MLSGRKTYLLAGLMIAYEVLGYLLGAKESVDPRIFMEALGLAALRAGVAKVGK